MTLSTFSSISPIDYAECAVLAKTVGAHVLARLDFIKYQPKMIVDVGCGYSEFSSDLQKRYPTAFVIALDLEYAMVQHTIQKTHLSGIQANALQLPFHTHSVDFIFSNLVYPWCNDSQHFLNECQRVLKPEGLLMFTALGPDTLKEIHFSEKNSQYPILKDMHMIGDDLLKMGFADPVLDVAYFTLRYRTLDKLFFELKTTGMIHDDKNVEIEKDSEGKYSLTFEVVHAHAWGGPTKSEDGICRVPLSELQR